MMLKKVINEKLISMVHCQRHRALVHAALAIPGTSVHSLFYTVRATNVLRSWNRRLVFNLLTRQITRVICVSHAVRDYIFRMSPYISAEKVVVIHNGVDVSAFDPDISRKEARKWLGIPEDGFCFGIVARLKKAKCHDILLRSFAQVVERFPETRLVLLETAPLRRCLRNWQRSLG